MLISPTKPFSKICLWCNQIPDYYSWSLSVVRVSRILSSVKPVIHPELTFDMQMENLLI